MSARAAAPSAGAVEVAPLYDVLCTVAYPSLSPKLAMKIGGRDWDRFAERCQVDSAAIGPRIGELCSMAMQHCDAVAEELARPGLDGAALRDFAVRVRRRAAVLERSA